ncbi:MAG: LysM peptidoglycan-binding domain-containing protein [Bacteroidota bacterium]
MRSIFVSILLFSSVARAQEKIVAATENGKPYIAKTVSNGQTLFSLGRHYSVAPKELAAFNKLDMTKGLVTGQIIKVPLTSANLFLAPCTICEKVYYKVPPKEGLFRIAANFNNMPLAELKKLNNLTADNVSIGQEIMVGYLKDGEGAANNLPPAKVAVKENQPPVKPEVVKKEVEDVVLPIKVPEKKVTEDSPNVVKERVLDAGMTDPNGRMPELQKSAFTSQYLGKMASQQTGTAAIFKSTSGWNDHKYYVLMNNVVPGTIVKVTAPGTSKMLFAKVLGELPPIKQNEGILLRISNAAAAVLGGGEEDMQVMVGY